MTQFEERKKRIDSALALKQPDRIPIICPGQCYPMYNAGFTTSDAFYDFDKYTEAMVKYLNQYEPDAYVSAITTAGQGPMMDLFKPKSLAWPGAPDNRIDVNSIHQFIEYPVLSEEDMDYFMADYTGWLLQKGYPAVSGLLEPMTDWDFFSHSIDVFSVNLVRMLSTPKAREMIQTIWKLSDMLAELDGKSRELIQKAEEIGFPSIIGARAIIPFDVYSDFHRGTLDTMLDIYEHPEVITHFADRFLEKILQNLTRMSTINPGKWVFVPLHKGMDSFLTDEQYSKLYWPHLQTIINHIVDIGMVPYIYTEGSYNSRVKYLKEVPKGKVIYSFEDADSVMVKKELGDTACLTGFFPVYKLHYGTKQECIDEVKRLVDILGPGGGYIFSTDAGYDHAKPENVEAMFDTLKNYGKY